MRDMRCFLPSMEPREDLEHGVEEFPLPVVEEWDDLVRRSDRTADVIDRHLDFESRLQGRELRPLTLCPEQKVSLVSDLTVV